MAASSADDDFVADINVTPCKMKLIQRRAYGFRNFENYRLSVRAWCC